MAEREGFRTAFRGFNRQDVMDYMDSVQAEFSQREAGLREGLSEANACLTSLTEQNEALKTAAAESEKKAESLRVEAFDRFEAMNAELLVLKKENERLRSTAAAKTEAKPVSDAEELIAVIDELRARGTDFLSASGRAGEECLDEMDALIEAWESALAQMRSKVGAARSDLNARQDAAGLRLSEMEAALKGEAPLTPVTRPTSAPAAAAPSVSATSVQPQSAKATQPAPSAPSAQPAPSAARLVSRPTRPLEGWRRFLENLLG